MLAEHQPKFSNMLAFPSPVVGSGKSNKIPTSRGVHLYADPATFFGPLPILYADCEGLDVKEKVPMGTRFGEQPNSDVRSKFNRNFFKKASRALAWATPNGTKTKEYAVKHLYPRLLYTFSDVIVFVLRHSKYVFVIFSPWHRQIS